MCSSTCVGMHLTAYARVRQTDCRTIFSANSLGQAVPLDRERAREKQSVCVCQAKSHSPKAHWPLEASSSVPTAERKQIWLKNISSDPPFGSHLGDLNLFT